MNCDEVMAQIAAIEQLRERQGQMLNELKRSVLLIRMWPDVFKAGRITSKIVGGMNERMPERARQSTRMEITRGDGVMQEFPAVMWPDELWNEFWKQYGRRG